ncbi:MAG: hypothetical protein ABI142_09935 [Bryocella sp.]
MKLRLALAVVIASVLSLPALAQQPPGVGDLFAGITSEPATHTAFTFDHDMLESMSGAFGADGTLMAGLNSITFENYRFREPAFYVPEQTHAIIAAYHAAGWKHLVEANITPRESAQPTKPITDLWLHFAGTDIDGVTVLVRGVKQMTVVEVTGILKPLDMVHLSGHFGIPKVDPNAVMVPAPDGR